MTAAPPVPAAAGTHPPAELVVVGASWGGFDAVRELLAGLPGDLAAAVAVCQHRSAGGEEQWARLLDAVTPLDVGVACSGEPLRRGAVVLAPGGYHLLVERGSFAVSLDDRVRWARPSADVLFESAADAYRDRVVAVVLTGANDDGAAGVRAVAARGGRVLVQDPVDAERPEMPNAAIATGVADLVAPLAELPAAVVRAVAGQSLAVAS